MYNSLMAGHYATDGVDEGVAVLLDGKVGWIVFARRGRSDDTGQQGVAEGVVN